MLYLRDDIIFKICIMGNFYVRQGKAKEHQERDKTRREKLSGYFFDLSKLVFAALVLGSVTPLFSDSGTVVSWETIFFGVLATYLFAFFANRILK